MIEKIGFCTFFFCLFPQRNTTERILPRKCFPFRLPAQDDFDYCVFSIPMNTGASDSILQVAEELELNTAIYFQKEQLVTSIDNIDLKKLGIYRKSSFSLLELNISVFCIIYLNSRSLSDLERISEGNPV